MASAISGFINQIRTAVYGEQVRSAIVGALEACYSDVENPDLQSAAFIEAINAAYASGILDITEVTQVSQMTNENIIYRYMGTEEGYIANTLYYYDGTAWVPIADPDSAKSEFSFPVDGFIRGDVNGYKVIKTSGGSATNALNPIPLKKGDVIGIRGDSSGEYQFYARYFVNGAVHSNRTYSSADATVPVDCECTICVAKNGAINVANEDVENAANEIIYIITKSGSATYEAKREFELTEQAPNLFDHNNVLAGYLLGNGGIHIPEEYAEETLDYTEIEPNTQYIVVTTFNAAPPENPYVTWCFYDENKALVGSRLGGLLAPYKDKYGNTICAQFISTTNTAVKYIRVTWRSYGNGLITFYKGTHLQSYLPPLAELGNIKYMSNRPSAVEIRFPFRSVNHRGFRENGIPENTIPAFKSSKIHGFDMVETDVYESADGVLFLWHNSTMEIDGTSKDTNLWTWEEIQTLDLGTGDYAGTKVPTFEEFARLCKNIDLWPYIEIKNVTDSGIAQLVDICKLYGIIDKCTWISFGVGYLVSISNLYKTARLGLCAQKSTAAVIRNALILRNGINEVFADVAEIVEAGKAIAEENNLPIEIWSINDQATIEAIPPIVHGVTSDSLIAGKIIYDANIVLP